MLARLVWSSYSCALLPQRVHTARTCRPLIAFGVVCFASRQVGKRPSRQAPQLDLRTRHRRGMTTLAESVGRENIPEPAAKLQKLSPPAEPPLLVKKLSEHATIPTRGSAKAAGYDLSRWGWAMNTLGPTLCYPNILVAQQLCCSRLNGMDCRAVSEDLLH